MKEDGDRMRSATWGTWESDTEPWDALQPEIDAMLNSTRTGG